MTDVTPNGNVRRYTEVTVGYLAGTADSAWEEYSRDKNKQANAYVKNPRNSVEVWAVDKVEKSVDTFYVVYCANGHRLILDTYALAYIYLGDDISDEWDAENDTESSHVDWIKNSSSFK